MAQPAGVKMKRFSSIRRQLGSFLARPPAFGSAGVLPLPGGTSHAQHTASVTVTIQFNRAGTVTISKTAAASWIVGPVANHNWAAVPNSTVGDNFWVRATNTSGTPSTGTTGSWLQMNSDRVWTVSATVSGSKNWSATFEIATDSGGASIVASAGYANNVTFL